MCLCVFLYFCFVLAIRLLPLISNPASAFWMCPILLYLQIDNDILLRRSSSLRQGLPSVGVSHGRRKSSLEEIGISHFTTLMQATNHSNPIKISLNGSIGMEVMDAHSLCLQICSTNSHSLSLESNLFASDAARGAHAHVGCAVCAGRRRCGRH